MVEPPEQFAGEITRRMKSRLEESITVDLVFIVGIFLVIMTCAAVIK